MRKIKPVKYKVWECASNDQAVCPYCGAWHDLIENTEISSDKEGASFETECLECGRTFIYTYKISAAFDTKPTENHYLEEREALVKKIKGYENATGLYDWQKEMLLQHKNELERLDEWIEKILGDEIDE